ncbi:MAG: hypothetical protein HFH80_01090 [Lachnospiraceae bacterium]|nr:hypothetical protein [Lachnospiraceae bacterium]
MKKNMGIIKIGIFMGVLLLPSLLWLGIRIFSPRLYQELDYDLGEKTAVEFPREFHMTDYTRQLEAYYNDNAPFRSTLISWQQKLSGALEGIYADHLQGRLTRLLYGQDSGDFLAPQVVGNNVLLGRQNWLFFAGDDSISSYRGTNLMEQEQMAACLDLMVQLQKLCDEKGIRLQFLILPNKEQVYSEYMPSYVIEDSYKRVDRFVDYVREHSNVSILYPLEELRQAKAQWQIYHQYDTHWNQAGAYVGTQALYRALGLPTTGLEELEVGRCDATTSDLLILGGLDASQYPPEQDYAINYRPEVTLSEVQGDKQPTGTYSARSDCGNDLRFVMVGDSFRCFMIDYLAKDFSHSVITYRETSDNRTDYAPEVVESIQNADILVMEAVERYDSKLMPAIAQVIDILQNAERKDEKGEAE